jgi:hypothetical protein
LRKIFPIAFIFLLAKCDSPKVPAETTPTTANQPQTPSGGEVKEATMVGNWKISDVIINRIPGNVSNETIQQFTKSLKEVGSMRFNADSTFETNTPEGLETGLWKGEEGSKKIYMIKATGVDTLVVSGLTWQLLTANVQTHKGASLSVLLNRVP